MTSIKERYLELQRHEAAVAIAFCENLDYEHPVMQMLRNGQNDEALTIFDDLDLQNALSQEAWKELTSALRSALRTLLIEVQDEWKFDCCTAYFSAETLQEIWDLDDRIGRILIDWLQRNIK